jgi:hypothetical protein
MQLRYARRVSFCSTILFLLAASRVFAQDTPVRQGFWFNIGLGYGSLGCQDCGDREGGASGGLALGGTVSQKVLLGVSSNVWTKSQDGVTLTAAAVTAAIRFYPSSTGRFFFLAGLGVGSVDLRFATGNVSVSASQTGGGALLGLGYDIRVGNNASLTPFWNGVGISYSDGDANFGQIGLGLTIH